jgi:competence protein ComEA
MKVIQQYLLASCLCFAAFAPLALAGEAVNINTANAETLMKILKGVGSDKASAIIAYRQQHGPFKSADQLVEVKGIGKKLVDMNREMITVGEAMPDSR